MKTLKEAIEFGIEECDMSEQQTRMSTRFHNSMIDLVEMVRVFAVENNIEKENVDAMLIGFSLAATTGWPEADTRVQGAGSFCPRIDITKTKVAKKKK